MAKKTTKAAAVKNKTRRTGYSQERGVQTRTRLLELTSQCIGEAGVHNLRYSHVAKLAKIPQALMGYHFPNLEALLLEVVQLELEKVRSAQVLAVEKHAAQPKKALAAYIRAPFELSARDKAFRATFSAFYHLAVVSPAFAEMNLAIRKMGRERIVNLITMVLATEGQLMNGQTVTREKLLDLATAVQGTLTGLVWMAASESGGDYQELANLTVDTCFSILGLD